jgi:hypothetical protein
MSQNQICNETHEGTFYSFWSRATPKNNIMRIVLLTVLLVLLLGSACHGPFTRFLISLQVLTENVL